MKKFVVIGGGISGLTVAFELSKSGIDRDDLLVLEERDTPGGNLCTKQKDGYLLETGPNGFLDNSPPTLDLVNRLGLNDELLKSNETSSIRFLFARGKLRKVPTGPLGMLTSGILPLGGALRVFGEPLIKKGDHPEESVFNFAARRIGKAAAATMVDAMVSGVFAGDAKKLELAAAFPKMAAMESKYGGLVKAMIALKMQRKKESKASGNPSGPGGRLTSFKGGFQTLPAKIAQKLSGCVRCNCGVISVKKNDLGYQVVLKDGSRIDAQNIILACPAWAAAQILSELDNDLSNELKQIPSSTITVVATAYKTDDFKNKLRGFGLLVPRNEDVKILGCLWTSSIWNNRAPRNRVLLRTMIGGMHDFEAIKMSDGEILALTATDLKKTMDLNAAPISSHIFRHPKGISQYLPGHTKRLKKIDALLKKHSGLLLSGSSYKGISVNHCIAEATQIAQKAIKLE